MELHSFRFPSQMLFSNWLMLFWLLLAVVNSWCVGWIVWISVCCKLACTSMCVFTCMPVWMCLSNLNAFHHSAYVRADDTHSAAMSNWNRLELQRQGNSRHACSLAVLLVTCDSPSGLLSLTHNEINRFVNCRKQTHRLKRSKSLFFFSSFGVADNMTIWTKTHSWSCQWPCETNSYSRGGKTVVLRLNKVLRNNSLKLLYENHICVH